MSIESRTCCKDCGRTYPKESVTPDGYYCYHCQTIARPSTLRTLVHIVPTGADRVGVRGVFAIRRGAQPFKGRLALPGVCITHSELLPESWQTTLCQKTAREIQVICRHDVQFEKPKRILSEFSPSKNEEEEPLIIGASGGAFHIGTFIPSNIALERIELLPSTNEQLCFSTHRTALTLYWNQLGLSHNIVL